MILEKLKQLTTIQLFTIYLRYLLGAAFVFASIVKIQGSALPPTQAALPLSTRVGTYLRPFISRASIGSSLAGGNV